MPSLIPTDPYVARRVETPVHKLRDGYYILALGGCEILVRVSKVGKYWHFENPSGRWTRVGDVPAAKFYRIAEELQ